MSQMEFLVLIKRLEARIANLEAVVAEKCSPSGGGPEGDEQVCYSLAGEPLFSAVVPE